MLSSTTPAVLATALAAMVSTVSAHGYVASIVAGGKTYTGSNPNWFYNPSTKPTTPGWFAYNQDNGFVPPDQFGNASAITCHKGATPGNQDVVVAAGSTVTLHWNTWPVSHNGPVIDYLAKCSGSCSTSSSAVLSFTKVAALGLLSDATPPGFWADNTIANNATFAWDFVVPKNLAAGYYVLRHEILALHSASNADGAQAYPQCINLQVTGAGTVALPAGVKATSFYTPTDPGILINIYTALTSYPMPGPALWTAAKKRSIDFSG